MTTVRFASGGITSAKQGQHPSITRMTRRAATIFSLPIHSLWKTLHSWHKSRAWHGSGVWGFSCLFSLHCSVAHLFLTAPNLSRLDSLSVCLGWDCCCALTRSYKHVHHANQIEGEVYDVHPMICHPTFLPLTDPHIASLCHAFAVWSLTADDIGVFSIHGTSTHSTHAKPHWALPCPCNGSLGQA